MKRNPPEKKELEELYYQQGSTISSVARHYGTNNPTVRAWLIDYDIPRKSHKQASIEANNRHRIKIKPSKEILSDLYAKTSLLDLSKYFNVSQQTIYLWFEEYNIELREHSASCKAAKQRQFENIRFSRDFLEEEYKKEKNIEELAKKLNVSRSYIRNQLVDNGIKIEPTEPKWRSKAEIDLYEYLISEFPDDEWLSNDKSIINPYEIDIVNLSKNIAIEYCGLYWHSEGSNGRKQDYHRNKYIKCKEKGIKLYTIFDSDDINKVKSLLLKVLGKTNKVGARKTKVIRIDSKQAMDFHRKHHLHSAIGGSFHCGLFLNDELLLVASFAKARYSKDYQYECSRITSHSDYTVVGGVSKVIKYFIKQESPESIVTFSDLRFGEGNVYIHCNFERKPDTAPNYWYSFKYTPILHSRIAFQKHKLEKKLEYFDLQKTEYENMILNGWDRIWDCGNAKYIWKNTDK